jgi:hypothetical protein
MSAQDRYSEQIAINGTHPSRAESPVLEGSAAKAIEDAFRDLIQSRYLYQKIEVDLSEMDAAITATVASIKERISRMPLGSQTQMPKDVGPERLLNFREEVRSRPWRLRTRHLSDNPTGAEIRRTARIGTQALGTDVADMNLSFYLPAVQLYCATCRAPRTFIALGPSTDSAFESPYPRKSKGQTEQIYVAYYRCETCRDTLFTVLVRRVGLRVHLCGFAPRRELRRGANVAEALVPILDDAEQAIAEGDRYGAFYHLRTMVEHYLKTTLQINIAEQIRGDELVEMYNQRLRQDFKSTLPSLGTAWEKLSKWMHTRTGLVDDYTPQRDAVCKHIEVVQIIGEDALTASVPKLQSTGEGE